MGTVPILLPRSLTLIEVTVHGYTVNVLVSLLDLLEALLSKMNEFFGGHHPAECQDDALLLVCAGCV